MSESLSKSSEYMSNEPNFSTLDSQTDSIPPTICLSDSDIEILYQICEIANDNYFSQPLPGYNEMQVYYQGALHYFEELNRSAQLEIVKTAHVSRHTQEELEKQKDSTRSSFEMFIRSVVIFNKGNLLSCHGIAHSVRTAIIANYACVEYYKNFKEFENISSRTVVCCVSASMLHDIGRTLGGDGTDIFGETSAFIAGEILNQVDGFSPDEIDWIKEAIVIGGINSEDVRSSLRENGNVLNEKQMIACIMGDADSFEFERFGTCDVSYTSIKKLGILTKNGESPDFVLNFLKKKANDLTKRIVEPCLSDIKSSNR